MFWRKMDFVAHKPSSVVDGAWALWRREFNNEIHLTKPAQATELRR